jgi:hypothetical protein
VADAGRAVFFPETIDQPVQPLGALDAGIAE